jgi:hypothetical protein
MVEAVTVRRDRTRPVLGISPTLSTSKFFDIKILPASDCAPRFTFQFHANPMIPIDQGGGGYPSNAQAVPFRERRRKLYFQEDFHTPEAPMARLLEAIGKGTTSTRAAKASIEATASAARDRSA